LNGLQEDRYEFNHTVQLSFDSGRSACWTGPRETDDSRYRLQQGIGFETIRALSSRGARIIGLARTIESARAACSKIGEEATPMVCDLADLASVDAAAGNLLKAGRIDRSIIANAGLMGSNQLEKRYGVEMQFLVNHLAHCLLVNRLLPLVPDNTGRIVIVSSSGSWHSNFGTNRTRSSIRHASAECVA
jgi:NAD(P)-dependent dehydrogenase (short-subunit alcohol dehydrogenase family)